MSTPKVSVITRTRNRPLLLQRARDSVLGQVDPPSWEWIVVNDAGDPLPVREVLQPALARFPRQVTVLDLAESKGMEHASNSAIRRASGEFLAIHDDDDSWDPAFLREMTAALDTPHLRDHGGLVCHSIRVLEQVSNDAIHILGREPFNTWLTRITPWELLGQNAFPPISFLFRRQLWHQLGGFDESLPVLGDWEFNLRMILRAPIGILPRPLALYHHRTGPTGNDLANSITAGHGRHRTWETRLRQRWHRTPPAENLPHFGKLSAIAASMRAGRGRLDALLSLPLRPGPQL